MNYRGEIAAVREERDRTIEQATTTEREVIAKATEERNRTIEQATAAAREVIAKAIAKRDGEIRRLRSEGFSVREIAPRVGLSHRHVFEILHPSKRAVYNGRRLEYWRRLHAVA